MGKMVKFDPFYLKFYQVQIFHREITIYNYNVRILGQNSSIDFGQIVF